MEQQIDVSLKLIKKKKKGRQWGLHNGAQRPGLSLRWHRSSEYTGQCCPCPFTWGVGLYSWSDGPCEELCTESKGGRTRRYVSILRVDRGAPCPHINSGRGTQSVTGGRLSLGLCTEDVVIHGSSTSRSWETLPRPPKGPGDRGPSRVLLPFARTARECFRSCLREWSAGCNILGP